MSTIKVSITGSNVARDNHWEIPSGSITPVRTLLIEAGPRNNRATTHSINFSTWTLSNVTRTGSATEAPDGTMTATLIRENTSAGAHLIQTGSSVTVSTLTGISIFVKPAGRNRVYVGLNNGSNTYAMADVILTGTGSINATVINNGTIPSIRVVPYSGSWYRVDVVPSLANAAVNFQLQLHNGTSNSYTGDGSSGVYVWGYNDGDFNNGSEIDGIAPTMFIRGTDTQTGSRNRDSITWVSPAPQPMTVYTRGIVQGTTGYTSAHKIIKFGTGSVSNTDTAGIYSDGTSFYSYYRTATSSITPSINKPGSAIELSMRIYTTGSGIGTQLSYALDDGAVTVGPSSSIYVGSFPTTWQAGNIMGLCDSDTNAQYAMSFAFRNIVIATGSKTMAQMRTLAGI